jgi:hypothetical protein
VLTASNVSGNSAKLSWTYYVSGTATLELRRDNGTWVSYEAGLSGSQYSVTVNKIGRASCRERVFQPV